MYKFLSKNGQMIAFGIGMVITVLFLFIVLTGQSSFAALSGDEKYTTGIFDLGIIASIALAVIAAIIALLFGIMQVASNPKGSLQGIGFLVLVAVLYFIGTAMYTADNGYLDKVLNQFSITDGQSAFISGAIFTSLAMVGIAALAFILSEIRNFFK